jgi:hypothetical protein
MLYSYWLKHMILLVFITLVTLSCANVYMLLSSALLHNLVYSRHCHPTFLCLCILEQWNYCQFYGSVPAKV